MDFLPFSGIDNEDLKLIFPNQYDTVYDATTDLEWLFYANEWTICGEGRPWQLPDPLDYEYDYDQDLINDDY